MGRNKRVDVALRRVYDVPSETDRRRILVEGFWPRGLSKDKASLHRWLKEIASSPKLRRWYGHRPERWAEFQARYHAELDANANVVRTLQTFCDTRAFHSHVTGVRAYNQINDIQIMRLTSGLA